MGEKSRDPRPSTQHVWRRLFDACSRAADWPATLAALAHGWRDLTTARSVRITAPLSDGAGRWQVDLTVDSTAQCQHIAATDTEQVAAVVEPDAADSADTHSLSIGCGDSAVSTVTVAGAAAWSADRVDAMQSYHAHVLLRLLRIASSVSPGGSAASGSGGHSPQSSEPQSVTGGGLSEQPHDGRLEALAEFAAGAGHEINNPLATIIGRAQLLLRDEQDAGRRQALEAIGGQAYRIRDMIGDAMLFARPPVGRCQSLDLSAAVQVVVDAFAETAQARSCPLQTVLAEDVLVWADPEQLSVVVSCLLRNALEAIEDGGQICVETAQAAGGSRLLVSDSGQGLSAEEREHLFDPFFSGRQAGRGLGFGLSKCWRIVSNHGGWIECESSLDCPTTFTVSWPASP